MVRSKRMRPVAELAENREQEAARRFGESQRALDEQKGKLQELLGYRHDYQQRYQQRSGEGMTVMMMQDFRRFMNQLDSAIRHQRQQIERYQRSSDLRRREWLASRTKSQAIDKVVQRFKRQEQHQQNRREQHENDEYAQNLFTRPKGETE